GIAPFITELNRIRNAHPALRWLRNLRFHHVDQQELICFSKRAPVRETTAAEAGSGTSRGRSTIAKRSSVAAAPRAGGQGGAVSDTVLVVVNLDPHQAKEATVWLDLPALGMGWHEKFTVTDELSAKSYRWGQANYVRLDPALRPAHIFAITRDLV